MTALPGMRLNGQASPGSAWMNTAWMNAPAWSFRKREQSMRRLVAALRGGL
jgi:hypothetical protein